jgi:hypothetical protein
MHFRKAAPKKLMLLVTMPILLLVGCDGAKHQRGDCIADEDGFVWFIADVDGDSYVARLRMKDKWGEAVKMEKSIGDRYELIPSCDKPFG